MILIIWCLLSVRRFDHLLVFGVKIWLVSFFYVEYSCSGFEFHFYFYCRIVWSEYLSEILYNCFRNSFLIINWFCANINCNFGDCVCPTALVATMVNHVEVFVRLVYRLRLFHVAYAVKRRFHDFSSEKGKKWVI